MSHLNRLKTDLKALANPEKAKILSGFFKTGKGEYGEGDIFLGVMVPEQRRVAGKYRDLPLSDVEKLLNSKVHEHRLVALLILVSRFGKGDEEGKKEIVDFYLSHKKRINNWDLVDLSAPKILGEYLLEKDKTVLYRLARSEGLWERRIAVMSTFAFIARGRFDDALAIAELLVGDGQDLIHKAVGWMLREIGKRDVKTEEVFLEKHAAVMPRTMLRYAVERFEEKRRKRWMTRQQGSKGLLRP